MASRKLEDLLPPARVRAERLIKECAVAGIDLLIYCTYRAAIEQTALYAQGRLPLGEVNELRRKTGLVPISEEENKDIVTNAPAGSSLHEYRLAFDCVPLVGGKAAWSKKNPLWQKIGAIGISIDLEWAGNWKGSFQEYPHFQYTGGLTLKEIKEGKIPT